MLPDTKTNVNNSFIHLILQEMVQNMLIAEVKDRVSSRKATLAETAFNRRSRLHKGSRSTGAKGLAMNIC